MTLAILQVIAEDCPIGTVCRYCPELVTSFQEGEISLTAVKEKICGATTETDKKFCCPDLEEEEYWEEYRLDYFKELCAEDEDIDDCIKHYDDDLYDNEELDIRAIHTTRARSCRKGCFFHKSHRECIRNKAKYMSRLIKKCVNGTGRLCHKVIC